MTTNNDFMQLMQFIRNSQNPQQFVMNMVEERMGNNPLFKNLLTLAKEGNGHEVETIARNMLKEQGLDFDKEFSNFKNILGC